MDYEGISCYLHFKDKESLPKLLLLHHSPKVIVKCVVSVIMTVNHTNCAQANSVKQGFRENNLARLG